MDISFLLFDSSSSSFLIPRLTGFLFLIVLRIYSLPLGGEGFPLLFNHEHFLSNRVRNVAPEPIDLLVPANPLTTLSWYDKVQEWRLQPRLFPPQSMAVLQGLSRRPCLSFIGQNLTVHRSILLHGTMRPVCLGSHCNTCRMLFFLLAGALPLFCRGN